MNFPIPSSTRTPLFARAPQASRHAAPRVPIQIDDAVLNVVVRDPRCVLELAASRFAHTRASDPRPVLRALLRREESASTALGGGVAIPHARIPGLDAPWTLYLRLADALPFDAPDGKPVRDFLVILVPETGDIDAHLALLAHVAQLPLSRAGSAASFSAPPAKHSRGSTRPGRGMPAGRATTAWRPRSFHV